MTALKRRKVGRTNLEVTELGLGGAPMGGFRATISDAEAVTLTDTGYDAGIRYFDTSPFYGYGRSELRMGAALREKPRESYVLSTKIGRILHVRKPGEALPKEFRENGLPGFVPQFDYTYDGVMRSLEHSHLRLGIDRIDIALIHDCDVWTHGPDMIGQRLREAIGQAYPALEQLRSEGVVKSIGIGINEADTASIFARETDIDCVLLAGRYSLLEQPALEEFFPLAERKTISVMLGGVFNSGILATGAVAGAKYNYKPAPEAILRRVKRIEDVCVAHRVPLAAAAMQFPLAHPAIASVVLGAVTAEEVKRNIAGFSRRIPARFWQDLVTAGLVRAEAPLPGKTAR